LHKISPYAIIIMRQDLEVIMNEKKFTIITVSIAFLAIVVVILLSIPWGGDKAAIDREYNSLEGSDHVFETLDFEEFFTKINNNETFQVYIGSSEIPEAEQFVYTTNKIAKEREIKTIYYLRSSDLDEGQLEQIKYASSLEMTLPTLMYWVSGELESEAPFISSLKDLDDYINWNQLLNEYFDECYS
jgi:hypothetical protein